MLITWIVLSVTEKFTERHVSVVHFSYVYVPFGVMMGTLNEPGGANFFAHVTFPNVRLDSGYRSFKYVHQTTCLPDSGASSTFYD